MKEIIILVVMFFADPMRQGNDSVSINTYGGEPLVFDNMDKLTASAIKQEIITTIENYEPRVEMGEVTVEPNYDNNEFQVSVQYYIVGIDVPEQELSFVLESTR